jgi:transposase-like protein
MEQNGTGSPRRKIVRRTTEQIKSLITEYENSGLSVREFCKQHQVKSLYLSRWLKRYRKNKTPEGFVAVCTPKEAVECNDVLFAEYRGIRFYQPVAPSYLKDLVS